MSIDDDPIRLFFSDCGWICDSSWVVPAIDGGYYIDKEACVLLVKVKGPTLEIHETGHFRSFELSNPNCFKWVREYLIEAMDNWYIISKKLELPARINRTLYPPGRINDD